MYFFGGHVPKDTAKAARWFLKGSEPSDPSIQSALGAMYRDGDGVTKNLPEAFKWYRKAAGLGHSMSQFFVGYMLDRGEGVLRDEIESLAWLNISAITGDASAISSRDIIERRLGVETARVAQKRSKEILEEIEQAKAQKAGTSSPTFLAPGKFGTIKASGSGAVVSESGYVLTAAHVVAEATSVSIRTSAGIKSATVVRVDAANDLAILKITDGTYVPMRVISSGRVRVGQDVATVGFPNVEIQGFSPKVTRGEISSLNGMGDDPRAWQISVPVQTGNSGGPLVDVDGNLIGVVVAKLGLRAAKVTGDLPQNVGYAVKSAYALALLEPFLKDTRAEPKQSNPKPSFEDMVARVQQSVVLVLVY